MTAMKRDLMIGSAIAIAMMIAASAARASDRTSDIAEIQALEQRLIDGIKAKDVNQIMSCYSDDLFAYDVVPPRQYAGAAAFQKPWQSFLGMFKGPINAEVNDLVINSDGEIAYSRSIHTSRERQTRASHSTRRFASRMSIARVTASG
jgi:ketosteroid isomerase-like protein